VFVLYCADVGAATGLRPVQEVLSANEAHEPEVRTCSSVASSAMQEDSSERSQCASIHELLHTPHVCGNSAGTVEQNRLTKELTNRLTDRRSYFHTSNTKPCLWTRSGAYL